MMRSHLQVPPHPRPPLLRPPWTSEPHLRPAGAFVCVCVCVNGGRWGETRPVNLFASFLQLVFHTHQAELDRTGLDWIGPSEAWPG